MRKHYEAMATLYRRRLPHVCVLEQPIFITWRLYGRLPLNRVFSPTLTSGQAFVAMDSLLDRARTGPLYLREPEIARLTVDAIQFGQDRLNSYDLHAYAVMPNHVHLLITPHVEIAKITHSLKRFTAREANRLLRLTGQPFWQDESYDHLVRDSREFGRIAAYVENNPIKAGHVADPGDFAWSSAAKAGFKPACRI